MYKSILVLGRITGAVIHCVVVFIMFDRHLLLLLTSLFFCSVLGSLCMCGTGKMLHCILVFLSLCISSHLFLLFYQDCVSVILWTFV